MKEYGYIPAALPDQNCYGEASTAKTTSAITESPVVRAAEKAEASIEEFMQKFYARVRVQTAQT